MSSDRCVDKVQRYAKCVTADGSVHSRSRSLVIRPISSQWRVRQGRACSVGGPNG